MFDCCPTLSLAHVHRFLKCFPEVKCGGRVVAVRKITKLILIGSTKETLLVIQYIISTGYLAVIYFCEKEEH